MASTTTNYGLHKIDLTDAPPDITVLNQNFDIIDEKLNEHDNLTASDVGARPDTWMPTASQVGALSDKGGTLSGNLKLLRGNSPTIEMKVLSDNGYTSMYQHGGTFTTSSGMSSDSDESFMVLTKPSEDDDSSIFRIGRTINNSSKYYKLYGEHNKPTASDVGALPLDGSVAMSGALNISNNSLLTAYTYNNLAYAEFQAKKTGDTQKSWVQLNANDDLLSGIVFLHTNSSGASAGYKLHGEHNKTRGNYTGNGSATSRTVDTKGLGNSLLIWSEEGYCLVSTHGAIIKAHSGSTVSGLAYTDVAFAEGVLTIASTSNYVNENGMIYYYQLL